jgi:hypothetical protein
VIVRVVPVLLLAGCIELLEQPDVGPIASDPRCDEDGDAAPTSFSDDIEPILRSACVRCHGGDQVESGLDVTSYSALRAGGTRSVQTIVIAGKPCTSVLYQKLTEAPPFGSRMPRATTPLSVAEQQLVHDWIAEGALDN